jgi:hypothetical protein
LNALTPRIYLTLRCNLRCWYCSNGVDIADYEELNATQWVERIRRLPGDEVVFTGGEPTLHAGLYEIVAGCRKLVVVYSNFARPLDAERLRGRRVHWRASCHATTREAAREWVANVRSIHELRQPMTLTTVHCAPEALEELRGHGICVDSPQYPPPPLAPPMRCTLERYLIAPDGTRYHCVGKLVRRDPSGIVAEREHFTVVCQSPDRCAPCDSLAIQRVVIE